MGGTRREYSILKKLVKTVLHLLTWEMWGCLIVPSSW